MAILCTGAEGAMLVNTYPGGSGQGFPVGGDNGPGWTWAMGFQTPGGAGYTLTSATFQLLFVPNWGALPDAEPVVGLFADNGSTRPGTLITAMSLAGPSLPGVPRESVFDNYTFTPDVPVGLSPGTNYWLGLNGVPGQTVEYALLGGLYLPNTGVAIFLGTTVFNATGAPLNLTSIPNFSVEGSLSGVPEPGTMLLAGLAGVFVVLLRRHRLP